MKSPNVAVNDQRALTTVTLIIPLSGRWIYLHLSSDHDSPRRPQTLPASSRVSGLQRLAQGLFTVSIVKPLRDVHLFIGKSSYEKRVPS